ncbi:MAG: UDP-galactopyranose mutase [Acidithiobacillus sp.]|jgi:UDP-galactopyranose mutase|uniref:UDP-galactopyranose mutase n=1 Tax=Acidithiobacillus sp. TaxID=1872118 RepID=UPI00355D2277
MRICIIGAGLTGAVIARELSKTNKHEVIVYEERNVVGGQCYDIKKDNYYESQYGPHIFHTMYKDVWDYVNLFTTIKPYNHKVKTLYNKQLLDWPINTNTMKHFFGYDKTDNELINIINLEKKREEDDGKKIGNNFEDNALLMCGRTLYEALIKPYTKKMWDIEPNKLSSELCKRIPIKFDNNSSFFNDIYQGLPEKGYTNMIQNMLEGVKVEFNVQVNYGNVMYFMKSNDFIINTGNINNLFEDIELPYRKILFVEASKNAYGSTVLNVPEEKFSMIRYTDYANMYGAGISKGIYEIPQTSDYNTVPLYPYPFKEYEDKAMKMKKTLVKSKIYSIGRLGSYKYLNMDQSIGLALDFSKELIKSLI